MSATETLVRAPAPPRAQQRRNAALLTLALLGVFVGLLTVIRSSLDDPPQKGPSGSSFATTPGGVGAFADLAREAGVNVVRLTKSPWEDPTQLSSTDTIVVLGADLDERDATSVLLAVYGGARLVADIGPGNTWFSERSPQLGWTATAVGDTTRAPKVSSDAGTAALTLETLGMGEFDIDTNRATDVGEVTLTRRTTLASLDGHSIAERFDVGSGEVIALADASMLSNQLLARRDNAAFALHLLADRSDVVFVESVHGYSSKPLTPTGLPWRAKWFIAGLLFATAVLMWSRSRRLGPPEPIERELAAPRSDFLRALAAGIDAASGSNKRNIERNIERNNTSNNNTINNSTINNDNRPSPSSTTRNE